MTSLFISDLHLTESTATITAGFERFLASIDADATDALFVLGDLFEVWVGDDHRTSYNDRVIEALRGVHGRGIRLYLMHGNRDFLLGAAFCEATGAELLPDPTVMEIEGRTVLLLHGDSLCTDDTAYMAARTMLRNPDFQRELLAKSIDERLTIAAGARAASRAHTAQTAMAIMDVNEDAVSSAFRDAGTDLMVHGHTHRPAVHELEVDERPVTRIVLGDWGESGWVLKFDTSGESLESFPLT